MLRSAGLILKVEQFVFDNEQPEGFIISQDPLPGRMVKENREIAVRVSKGPEEVEMLSVLGASTREAKLNLTQSGFVLGEQTEAFDPQALPNTILEQWPEPGEIVVKGTAVNLVINKGERGGSAAVVVPDFKGREFSAVQAQLQELGLDVGNAWPEYSTIFAEGRIVEQNPRAGGTEVEAGSRIDFVYSQGEAKPAAPETTPTEPKEEVEWVHENLWKTEEVTILVPPGGGEQEVVILVIDDFGAREVYREKHEGGEVGWFVLFRAAAKARNYRFISAPASSTTRSFRAHEKGIILKGVGGQYEVQTAEGLFLCTLRGGRLRLDEQRILVGDQVEISGEEGRGVVERILPRLTELVRPAIANVNQVVVVFAAENPKPSLLLLDRILVHAELARLDVLILFNKGELAAAGAEKLRAMYAGIPYETLITSAKEGWGLAELQEKLSGRISTLAGPSGAGKSSLLNALLPELDLEVQTVSVRVQRGRHTTRTVTLCPPCRQGAL